MRFFFLILARFLRITLKNFLTCSLQGTARLRIDEQRQPRLGSSGILHPRGISPCATVIQIGCNRAVGELLVGQLHVIRNSGGKLFYITIRVRATKIIRRPVLECAC